MACENTATYFVERGYHYKKIETRCGSTTYQGGRVVTAFCNECANDPHIQAEHERPLRNAEADNAWLRSAGWGEM